MIKIYKPGDPEFDQVARQCKHVAKIRKGLSEQGMLIWEERAPNQKKLGKLAGVNKIREGV